MSEEDRRHLWIPRENLKREPVGHGIGGEPPLFRKDYAKHGKTLQRQIESLREVVSARRDAKLTKQYIVEVAVPKSVPIRKHKARLEQVGIEFIGYSRSAQNVAIAKITKPAFSELTDRIQRYATSSKHVGRSNLSVIEQFGEVPIDQKVDVELRKMAGNVPCVISLYNELSNAEKQEVLHSLFRLLQERGISDLQIHNLLSGTATLVAELPSALIEEVGEEYLTVKSITRNGRAVITKTVVGQSLPEGIEVLEPETKSIVAVVDSGVCEAGLLSPLVCERYSVMPFGTAAKDVEHGTLVASRVLFGERFESLTKGAKLAPSCQVIDLSVFGVDSTGEVRGLSEADLITVLDNHVPAMAQKARVFNLSLGFDRAVESGVFSLLATEIDFLSKTFDVLFVIAAGNISQPTGDHPLHFLHPSSRIQPPSESLLGLSVGSVAKYSIPGCISKPNEISAFSCIGPGSDGGLKPEVVAHGGNLLEGWIESARVGVCGLDASGTRLAYSVGTSFAAPLISRMAARLFAAYPGCSVNLVKALLCHFASPVSVPSVDGLEDRRFYGFGEPCFDATLRSAPNAVTYLYTGRVKPENFEYIPFHIPKTVAGGGGNERSVRVRMTLVFDPPVNSDNPIEYSKSRMTLALYKATESGFTAVPAGDDSHVLPWGTAVHFDRSFSRSYLTGEWQARVRVMTRGDLPEDFEQGYALVIEVIDPNGGTDVYRDVLNEFGSAYGSQASSQAA